MYGNNNDDAPSTRGGHRVTHHIRSSVEPTPHPVFMPETFTGVGCEWSEQFDLAAEVNHWDESLKHKFISPLLPGSARDMCHSLLSEAKNNYALLKAAVTRCFEMGDSDD